MAYNPQTLSVYVAAYSGVMAGSAASGKVPTSPNPLIYANDASIAAAFAQSFDTQWGAVPVDTLILELIEFCSYGVWDRRTGTADTGLLLPTSWNGEVIAIIAEINAAVANFAAAGIVPPGGNGTRQLPRIDETVLLCWDFQTDTGGDTFIIGQAPTTPFVSTGSAKDALSVSRTSTASSGGVVTVGPGGKGLVYACDFFFLSPNTGSLATALNPSHVADNSEQLIEAYFLLTSLSVEAQGIIVSKAFGPTWVAPFNAIEINLKGSGNGFIEFGCTDSGDLTTEIGTDTSSFPRSALRVGYNYVALRFVKNVGSGFTAELYINGGLTKTFSVPNGVANGTGQWFIGGNTLTGGDGANIRYSRISVSSSARTPDYIATAAKNFLTD